MSFDSRVGTWEHIHAVRENMDQMVRKLLSRALSHDRSKLHPPEREWLDEVVPKLSATSYGSREYQRALKENAAVLREHYRSNDHHAEHYENGVSGMSLLALCEMMADWKAATVRHPDGDVRRSLEVNRERYGIEPQLYSILLATIEEMGW